MNQSYSEFIEKISELNEKSDNSTVIKYNEPMSRHTSFRIGGVADLYLVPKKTKSLCEVLKLAKECDVRTYIVGNGTNLLVDDAGFRGAIISTSAISSIDVRGDEVYAEAGAPLNLVCKTARDSFLGGLEFAYGIPGSVGGAVFMNAGAYGGEISAVLKESTYLDLDDLTVHTIGAAEHNYGYRDSVYRHTNRVILSAVFTLTRGEKEEISALMNDYMGRRISKQPLDMPNAGSIFKRYPGRYTGQMIEECGLKGYSVGGAEVSEKHAGFIVNRGNATSDDVVKLIDHITETVYKRFGCRIEREVIYLK